MVFRVRMQSRGGVMSVMRMQKTERNENQRLCVCPRWENAGVGGSYAHTHTICRGWMSETRVNVYFLATAWASSSSVSYEHIEGSVEWRNFGEKHMKHLGMVHDAVKFLNFNWQFYQRWHNGQTTRCNSGTRARDAVLREGKGIISKALRTQ